MGSSVPNLDVFGLKFEGAPIQSFFLFPFEVEVTSLREVEDRKRKRSEPAVQFLHFARDNCELVPGIACSL